MKFGAWTIAATISIFMALIAIALLFAPLQQKPHTLWVSDGLTIGEDLKLFDSGEYTSEPWCDICQRTAYHGKWSKNGEILMLTPADANLKVRKLLVIEKYGCEYMHDTAYPRPPEDISPSRISPSDFTSKDGCMTTLMDNDFRKYQERRRRKVSSNNSFKPTASRFRITFTAIWEEVDVFTLPVRFGLIQALYRIKRRFVCGVGRRG